MSGSKLKHLRVEPLAGKAGAGRFGIRTIAPGRRGAHWFSYHYGSETYANKVARRIESKWAGLEIEQKMNFNRIGGPIMAAKENAS